MAPYGPKRPCRKLSALHADLPASAGRTEEARKLLSEVENGPGPLSPYQLACGYFVADDKEKGFHWLEEAYRRFDGSLYSLAIDYELDDVRSDPRYKSLIKRLGLA